MQLLSFYLTNIYKATTLFQALFPDSEQDVDQWEKSFSQKNRYCAGALAKPFSQMNQFTSHSNTLFFRHPHFYHQKISSLSCRPYWLLFERALVYKVSLYTKRYSVFKKRDRNNTISGTELIHLSLGEVAHKVWWLEIRKNSQ